MRLYHGSNLEIAKIQLSACRPYKDFGRGFYLTDIRDQAFNMAKRVSRIYGGVPVVNAFNFDESFFNSPNLKVKSFDTPTEEWAEFVMNNRNRQLTDISIPLCNQDNKYDIVTGPVANDDISTLFRQFTDGLITKQTLVVNLTYKKLTRQFSFHTETAVCLLLKTGVFYE